jgi:hypothetical protein
MKTVHRATIATITVSPTMPRKPKPVSEQSRRFMEFAADVGANATEEEFERFARRVVMPISRVGADGSSAMPKKKPRRRVVRHLTLPDPASPPATDAEWEAYWIIGQIKEIASPGFAHRLEIAREEGLLEPLLAGDLDRVAQLASERIKFLSAQIHWVWPSADIELFPPKEDQESIEKAGR